MKYLKGFCFAFSGVILGAIVLALVTLVWLVLCIPMLLIACGALPVVNKKPLWRYREYEKKLPV